MVAKVNEASGRFEREIRADDIAIAQALRAAAAWEGSHARTRIAAPSSRRANADPIVPVPSTAILSVAKSDTTR